MRKAAVIAAVLSLGIATGAFAGEVSGTVYDQRGTPLAGIAVSIDGQQATTRADGSFHFADIAEGQHMVATSGQRVAVQVAEDGVTTRNLFLLSRRARAEVAGPAIDQDSGNAFAEALDLAEQMLDNDDGAGAIAWRWNDSEA